MLGIVRYRNTPRKSRSADREIAQSATHKRNHLIAPRFRTDELWVRIKFEQLILKRRPLDLLPVFVCAGEKKRIRAQHTLPPRNGVTGNRCVGMSYVRTSVHVVNRRRNVELPAHSVPSAQLTPVPTIPQ